MNHVQRLFLVAAIGSLVAIQSSSVMADCAVAHTHIGVNPTWQPADWSSPGTGFTDPDSTDNNKLWFFSLPPVHWAATPDWPAWGDDPTAAGMPFLKLVMETDEFGEPIAKPDGSGDYLWTCRFNWSEEGGYGDPDGLQHLDGWHSAFGPQGAWNLESIDESTEPAWDIGIRRESATNGVGEDLESDFFLLLPNDSAVLWADDQTHMLETEWLADEQAWGIHSHMGFCFWLPEGEEQIVNVSFVAFDQGGVYEDSDVFEMGFVTIPEPGTVGFLVFATTLVLRRRK